MGLFSNKKRNSSSVAKERLKLLLVAERIHCSPNMLIMLKNDMIQTASKYVVFNENQVSITYSASTEQVIATFPIVHNNQRKRNQNTNVKVI